MTKEEFQKLNINFRRVSSDFLNTNNNNYHRMLKKFLNYINNNPVINGFIKKHTGDNIDFSYIQERDDYLVFKLPIDDSEEVSYIYQLLNYVSTNNIDVFYLTFRYGSHKSNNSIRSFNNQVVKPLIDHINIYLTELKIDLGYQDNQGITNQFTFKQDFRGQINQASNGSIVSATQNYNESHIEEIKELAADFLSTLTDIQGISSDEKLELLELLEVTIQDLEQGKPKKSIIRIGMDKIKKVTDTVDSGTTLFFIGMKLYEVLNNLPF